MIVVTTNQNDFGTDIHNLVKAFYPTEEVKVYLGDDAGFEELSSDAGFPDIDINFFGERILLMIYPNVEEFDENEEGISEQEKIRRQIANSNLLSSNSSTVHGIDIDENMDRLLVKNALKQLLYSCLSSHTGTTLPWGALTGVRPVKIIRSLLEDQHDTIDEETIVKYMQEVYFCSEEKAQLGLEIAKKEREIITNIDLQNSYSLYIAIPFCPTTCLYCSFTSYPIMKYEDKVEEYMEALFREIDFIADIYQEKRLITIYIGGGTPTTLSPEILERLLKKINKCFNLGYLSEFTVEAGRPDSIKREKLEIMKRLGVNRISINPQSMNDETLNAIGRNHTAIQVNEAFQLARDLGFTNINMDIILGLPNETISDVKNTLAAVKKLRPDSLTIHSLAIKRGAKLTEWVNENGHKALKNTGEIMKIASECAKDLGMSPYYLYRQKNISGNLENIGYATPGHYGLYNVLMMEELQTIIAAGAGSITKRLHEDGDISRCANLKEPGEYIARIKEMIDRKRELLL